MRLPKSVMTCRPIWKRLPSPSMSIRASMISSSRSSEAINVGGTCCTWMPSTRQSPNFTGMTAERTCRPV